MKPISAPPFHRPYAQIVGHLPPSPLHYTHSSFVIPYHNWRIPSKKITHLWNLFFPLSITPAADKRHRPVAPSVDETSPKKNKNKHLRWMFIQSASVPLDGVKQSHYWPAPAPISATWGADRDLPRPWPPLIGSPAQMTDKQGAQRGICFRVVYRCVDCGRFWNHSCLQQRESEAGGLFYSSFKRFFIQVFFRACVLLLSRPPPFSSSSAVCLFFVRDFSASWIQKRISQLKRST